MPEQDTTATHRPRRTCPACQRRYAGLIDPDCPVCDGIGLLSLGAAALSTASPGAVARAVELYLETRAQRATTPTTPYADRRTHLEAAVAELHLAGILAGIADTGTPARSSTPDPPPTRAEDERDAFTIAVRAGTRPTTAALNALVARGLLDLTAATSPSSYYPTASANGNRTHLALVADPIDPLGPDLAKLAAARTEADHAARVLAGATHHLTRHPRRATR